MKAILLVFRILGLLLVICSVKGQVTESIQIPMRDGKSLAADIYLPNLQDTFPTILIMTPYGKIFYSVNGLPLGIGNDIAASRYAVVVVDWRCRFASLAACSINSDNGEDGYDVVEWIAEQSWSTGKIGMWGPSALGNVQYETAAEQPPHLICCVPEVAAPHFSYDKYYPGGSLKVETIETLDVLFGIAGPIVNNPHFNLIWQIVEDGSMYPEKIEVPFLLVGGWYDQNTDQVLRMFDTLQSSSLVSVRAQHRLLMGPWVHGGTGLAFVGSENQGALSYPEAALANTREAIRFFDYYLRGVDNGWGNRAKISYFQMGLDEWMTSSEWPPTNIESVSYYLAADATLSTEVPSEGSLSFIYDPADPSPSVGGKSLNLSLDQGPYDQGPLVESREDVLKFTTEPFMEPLSVAGSIVVKLQVSSDQLDTDFAIRITEVYPDGRSMLLVDGIQRMRFREGYRVQDTAFMKRGVVYPISIVLDDIAATFLPGQRLRLVISSSNYPRYNRNMNTGGDLHPNSNFDTLVDPLIANNTIHFGGFAGSHLVLPTLPMVTSSTTLPQEFSWQVYPNPADAAVNLKFGDIAGKIKIYDTNGKEYFRHAVQESHLTIQVDQWAPGIYFILWQTDRQQSIQKLVRL